MTATAESREALIRAHTMVSAAPLVPEITLRLTHRLVPLWEASETELATLDVPPPYWAFAWPGSQALARHLLDHPGLVAGRRVLDVAAGCGLAGLAAARAGAAAVTCADIDALAIAACRLNAELNGLAIAATTDDLLDGDASGYDVVVAGDVCYERDLSRRMETYLRRAAAAGALVLIADPGRAYPPEHQLEARGRYEVPTLREIENRDSRETTVYAVAP